MLYILNKDKKTRNLFNCYEKKKLIYKFLLKNNNIALKKKKQILFYIYLMPSKITHTRIKNRCLITGHGRGILRDFQLCRQQFKKLANDGKFLGVKKAS